MKYLLCIGFPLFIQALVTFVISQAASGGGSFVGLGAMLLGLIGIPLTAIVNFAMIRSYRRQSAWAHFNRSFLIGLILPALQIALLILVSVFRL